MSVYRELGTLLKLYLLSVRIWLLHISKPRGRKYSFKSMPRMYA
jgi:hypothetical protein